jgi:hypothetical protein
MTPQEVEQAARERYNAVNDPNWSSSEIMSLIYAACLEMAREALPIERTYSTTSVASQQEYSFPTNLMAIKRITYGGNKLLPITMREDDALTLNNQSTTATGTPQYYWIWNRTISLRPIPSSSGETIKIWAISRAQPVTSTSTLEIPTEYHMDLVNYVVSEMYAKDKDLVSAKYYKELWHKAIQDAKRWVRMSKRRDSFAAIQDEESLPTTILGAT